MRQATSRKSFYTSTYIDPAGRLAVWGRLLKDMYEATPLGIVVRALRERSRPRRR